MAKSTKRILFWAAWILTLAVLFWILLFRVSRATLLNAQGITFAGYQAFRSYSVSAPGSDTGVYLINSAVVFHQVTWTTTGTVSTCTFTLDSSINGTTWTSGGIFTSTTCTSPGQTAVSTSTPVNYVRLTVATITGGGSINLVYTGFVTQPSAGGTVTSLTATSPVVITPSPTTTTGVISCPTCSTSNPLSGMTPLFLPKAATATTITGNSALDDGSTVASTISTSENINIAGQDIGQGSLANCASGTVLNKLAERNTSASPACWTLAALSSTKAAGPCVANCGNSGTPVISTIGRAPCVFDGATTVGHIVIPSASTQGDCSDSGIAFGGTISGTTDNVAVIDTTNGSAGTFTADFNPPDLTLPGAAGGGKLKGSGANTQVAYWTSANQLAGASTFTWSAPTLTVGSSSTSAPAIVLSGSATPYVEILNSSGSNKQIGILMSDNASFNTGWELLRAVSSNTENSVGFNDPSTGNSSGQAFVITSAHDVTMPLGNTSYSSSTAANARSTSNAAFVVSGTNSQPQLQLGNANNQTSMTIANGSAGAANTGLVISTGSGSHTGLAVTSASTSLGEMDLAFLQTTGAGSWTAFKLIGPTSTWGWFVDDTGGIYQLQDVTNSQAVMACNEASAKDDCQIGKLGASPGAPPTGISLGDSSSNVFTVNHSGVPTHVGPSTVAGPGVTGVLSDPGAVTNQTASQSTVTAVASTPTAGGYTIRWYVDERTACSTVASGGVTFTFNWTDATAARSFTSAIFNADTSSGTGSFSEGAKHIFSASGQAITYSSTYNATCGTGGPFAYDVNVWVTRD